MLNKILEIAMKELEKWIITVQKIYYYSYFVAKTIETGIVLVFLCFVFSCLNKIKNVHHIKVERQLNQQWLFWMDGLTNNSNIIIVTVIHRGIVWRICECIIIIELVLFDIRMHVVAQHKIEYN